MANWRICGDLMLKRQRSVGKVMGASSIISSTSRFLGSYGGGCFPLSESFLRRTPSLGSLLPSVLRKAPSYLPTGQRFSSLQAAEVGEEAAAEGTRFPYLMVPPSAVAGSSSESPPEDFYHFFSVKYKKVVRIKKKPRLPWQSEFYSPDDSCCIGSSHGWLAFIDERDCSIFLFNPFFTASSSLPYVPLPSVETLPTVLGVRVHKSVNNIASSLSTLSSSSPLTTDIIRSSGYNGSPEHMGAGFFRKLILSSAPSINYNNNWTAMAIQCGYPRKLVFCKQGDTTWTVLDNGSPAYDDVVYSEKDQLYYALGSNKSVVEAWDPSDPSSPKHTLLKPSFIPSSKLNTCEDFLEHFDYSISKVDYLVESSGNLLLVVRFIAGNVNAEDNTLIPEPYEDFPEDIFAMEQEAPLLFDPLRKERLYRTLCFHVYKLDFVQKKWEPMDCLGDQALFLGSNHAFSLSACDFPELNGNSVYFTDDKLSSIRDPSTSYGGHDSGVFNLENGRITPCFPSSTSTWKIQPPPIWLLSNSLQA